jgi:hypothetical protein
MSLVLPLMEIALLLEISQRFVRNLGIRGRVVSLFKMFQRFEFILTPDERNTERVGAQPRLGDVFMADWTRCS